jgi:hypothetical protein
VPGPDVGSDEERDEENGVSGSLERHQCGVTPKAIEPDEPVTL